MKGFVLVLACALLAGSAFGQVPAALAPLAPNVTTTPVPPTVAPPQVAPPQVAPPQVAPPQVAPPQVAPPQVAPPRAPPQVAPPQVAPPQVAPPRSGPTPAPVPPTAPPTSGPTPSPTTAPTTRPPATPPTPGSPPATPAPTANAATNTGSSTSPPVSGSGPSSQPTDADILYFAYNLEIFEAQFYSCAATGSPLPSNLLGGGPSPSGCRKASLTSNVGTYAAELAREETAHVALLQKALQSVGVNPVAPQVDISSAFAAAAQAAFNTTQPLNPTFDPYANDYFFLHASFLFEDLGASAYIGALNSISNSSYRTTAAQIGAAESYHASLGRTLLYQTIDVTPAYNSTVRQITDAIVNVLNRISGSPQLKYQIYNQQGAGISNVDSNGLVPAASAQQVLRVVTLGAQSGSGGGFFPNNLQGNVKN